MKFEIHKEKLKDALSKLRNSLAVGAVNPVLEHFFFDVTNNILTLKSTNIQVTTIWKTKIESDENFSFTLPGLILSSLVSSLENDIVFIEYASTTKDVTLTCGKYTWESTSGEVVNYPQINIPSDLKEIKLPANFTSMLKTVFFSISNDITKPDLNSLCIDINKDSSGKLSLISTDRVRLSCASDPIEFEEHKQFIVPRSTVTEIIKLEPTSLMYGEDKKSIYFKSTDASGTFILRSSLTNAKYPDINAYLDDSFEVNPIKFNKNELVKALKRIKVTSDKVDKVGTIEFTKDKATISTLGPTSKSKEEVPVDLGSSDIPNPFNIKLDLMLDYLNQEVDDKVYIKIIKGMCLVFDKDNYRHVMSIER